MKTHVAKPCEPLWLGRQGEDGARCILFDISAWQKRYGKGTVQLLAQRAGDTAPYPCRIVTDGDVVSWTITSADVAVVSNYGRCELLYFGEGNIVKSAIWTTMVSPSLSDPSDTLPEPQRGWVDQVLQAASEVKDALTKAPYIGENGFWYVWDASSGQYVNTGTAAGSGTVFEAGDGLILQNNVLSVDTANDAEQDNTRPITSAAVYTEIGNIDVLLQTI